MDKIQLPKIRRKMLVEKRLSKERQMEDLFLHLCEGLEIREDRNRYPNSIFLMKNGEVWFEIEKEQNEKNGKFWCSFEKYWSVFEKKLRLNYTEIQSFTKDMVERHFKLSGLTPNIAPFFTL